MKILMVCLGNICRSPMAEGVLSYKAEQAGIALTVDSAGTSGWHEGEKPDRRARETMRKMNMPIDHQRSRQFVEADFDRFDRIYVMDNSNYRDVLKLARNADDEAKVKRILDEIYPDEHVPVPDPYYGGDDGFDQVFQLLNSSCDKVIAELS